MPETLPIYAHRGMLNYHPENTAASFDAARRSPCATGSEGDIQRTQDGRAVILHENLRRTTNVDEVFPHLAGKEIVRAQELRLADLKRLDAGRGEKILTVEEFACQFPSSTEEPYHFAYEIKADDVTGEVVETALAREPLEHSIFIGFNERHLDEVKKQEPDAQTFRLFRPGDAIPLLSRRDHGHGIGVRIDDCPEELLRKATRYKVPVLGYSPMIEPPSFPADVTRLYNRRTPIQGLIVNNPDQFSHILADKRSI